MRRYLALSLALLAFLVLSESKAAAAPLSILFDDSHDTDGDELLGNFSELRTIALAAGHTIVELDGSAGALTPAVLASHDVVMVFDAELAFTTTEIANIQSFVSGGGLLFVAGDRPTTGVFARTSCNT